MMKMATLYGSLNGSSEVKGFTFLHLMLTVVITFAATHALGWFMGR